MVKQIENKKFYQMLEDALLENLHLYSYEQIALIEWGSKEMRPKRISKRLGDMIHQKLEARLNDKPTLRELQCISQGTRSKESKTFHKKIQEQLIKRKEALFDTIQDPLERNNQLVDTIYLWASNTPSYFGTMSEYRKDYIDELLTVYEEDLVESVRHLDQDRVARLAQAIYIFKTKDFDRILWRVEKRTQEISKELTP